MIAYLRDFGFNYCFLSESFETSVPWDNVLVLCNSVKERIRKVAAGLGVKGTPFVSSRVTQVIVVWICVGVDNIGLHQSSFVQVIVDQPTGH